MNKKDTRLTLRISSKLKGQLEEVAAKEGRSVAQITEAFIRAGIHEYKSSGAKYFQPWISRAVRSSTAD